MAICQRCGREQPAPFSPCPDCADVPRKRDEIRDPVLGMAFDAAYEAWARNQNLTEGLSA